MDNNIFALKFHQGAIQIQLRGKLTMSNSMQFEKYFRLALEKNEGNAIGINMENLEFIDSSGLSSLIKLSNELKHSHKDVIYFGASSSIVNIIKVARLNTLFFFTTEQNFEERYPSV
jgi:anti-anti-sigma factor